MSIGGMVLVLGGTSGIGLATDKYLQKNYYKVVVAGRNIRRVDGVEAIYCDVLSESSVKNCFKIIGKLDPLIGLVYLAGITVSKNPIDQFE
jgi:NAD(P)-dependent dehydrogenase (short-subunit alcohol dehydrogenase family)